MIGIDEDGYLVIRHCVVHHWVEVARVVVVHYSYLLHMSVIACFTDFTDVYRCLQMFLQMFYRCFYRCFTHVCYHLFLQRWIVASDLLSVHFWRTRVPWRNSVRALQSAFRITASWEFFGITEQF